MENNQMNFLGENSAEKELKALQKQVARKDFIIDELSSPKSKQKDMAVFTHAKKLCEYIFVITEKSPKKYRWSIIARLQNYSSQIIDYLYQANFERGEKRLAYQTRANVYLHMLDFYADTAKTMQAINNHQCEVIAKQICEVQKLLAGWIKSSK